MRVCRTCGRELPESEFHRRENGRLRTECRTCIVAKVRRWRAANPEKYREQQRRSHAAVRADPARAVREREADNARRRSHTARGRTCSGTCKRCGAEFEYQFVQRRRELCELCRRHESDWKKFGLSGPEAAELRARGACDICGKSENPGGRFNEFHIDHCHDSNRVRGLLCAACNTVLGLMGDDPARLRAAADYLER